MSHSPSSAPSSSKLVVDFPSLKEAVVGVGISLYVESHNQAQQTLVASLCYFSHYDNYPGHENGHTFEFKLNLAPDGTQMFVSQNPALPFAIKRDPAMPQYFHVVEVKPLHNLTEAKLNGFESLHQTEPQPKAEDLVTA